MAGKLNNVDIRFNLPIDITISRSGYEKKFHFKMSEFHKGIPRDLPDLEVLSSL